MQKVYVIAEIGINHNGSENHARKLIDQAYKSGCHAVKFQKRNLTCAYQRIKKI